MKIFSDLGKYIKILLVLIILSYIFIKLYKPIIKISFPFLMSLIFAYLLGPAVNYFTNKNLHRLWSIIITYFLIIVLLFVVIYFLFPIVYSSFSDLITKVPDITDKYKVIINEMIIRYQISDLPSPVKQGINQNIENAVQFFNNFVVDILSIIQKLIANVFYIVLIPIITFYFLKDGDYLKQRLISLIPKKYRDETIVTWYQIDLVLKRFLRGELVVAATVGLLTSIGLYIIGVKFALVLGFIAGVTNFIPYLGPFLGVIPSVLIAFADSPMLAFKTLVVFLLIQQIDASVISPKVVGGYVGLHPVTIIFSILLSERLFGLIGMFFALPVTLIIIVIFERIINNIVNYTNKENI